MRFGPLLELVSKSSARSRCAPDGTFADARGGAAHGDSRLGAIVNITSLNAVAPSPDAGAYPTSKAGVALLTQHFALVLGPHGVRVNAVAPGFIDAGMSAPIYEDPGVRAMRGSAVPVGSLGTAEDVAEAVAFLASDKARYTTGHTLMVDGGVCSASRAFARKAPMGAHVKP